ncbi:hypothetical protein E4U11_001719 [Claviceps purpurea]|nr:hypothetical protein E4U11_001719 [Claviceps purpurea]
MSSSEATPTMAELVERGHHFVAAEKYKLALEPYHLAMRKCPYSNKSKNRYNPNYRCNARKKCSCKNFKKAVALGGSILGEAMRRVIARLAYDIGIASATTCTTSRHWMVGLQRLRRWVISIAPRMTPNGFYNWLLDFQM